MRKTDDEQRTIAQPEDFARALLARFDLPYSEDLSHIAGRLGLTIREVEAHGFESALVRAPGRSRGIIAVRRDTRELSRKRFSIAHEIGHHVLPGHGFSIAAVCANSGAESWDQSVPAHEEAADRFASELLLPSVAVRSFVEKHGVSLQTARRLSARFCTSLTATLLKCVTIADYPCAAIVSTDGVVTRVKRNSCFPHTISPGRSLRSDTLAWHLSAGVNRGEDDGMVPATAWLDHREYNVTGMFLRENSIPLPSYDKVLTVLTTV